MNNNVNITAGHQWQCWETSTPRMHAFWKDAWGIAWKHGNQGMFLVLFIPLSLRVISYFNSFSETMTYFTVFMQETWYKLDCHGMKWCFLKLYFKRWVFINHSNVFGWRRDAATCSFQKVTASLMSCIRVSNHVVFAKNVLQISS